MDQNTQLASGDKRSNDQEEARTGKCAFPHNGPWSNDVFVPALYLSHYGILGRSQCSQNYTCNTSRFMYTNDLSCYGTAMALAVILINLLL